MPHLSVLPITWEKWRPAEQGPREDEKVIENIDINQIVPHF